MARILDAARDVERRLETLSAPGLRARAARRARPARAAGVRRASPRRTGAARLGDVERYLQGAARRLERLPDATAVDRDRMRARRTSSRRPTGARLDAWPRGRALPQALREVPWMIEELRVSQFAQGLGTRGPVSAKRIRRALEEAAA